MTPLDRLPAALAAAAPRADARVWLPALDVAFRRFGFNTPQRISAALGQFVVEAGPDFSEVEENLNYTSPSRLLAIFPNEVHSLGQAADLVGKPQAIANTVYANRLGNGDAASGDGWRFRGRGLIQITGRDEYTALAAALDLPLGNVASWMSTAEGAAVSGVWYFVWRKLLPAMDAWDIRAVTRGVNGVAMLDYEKRLGASIAALAALQAPEQVHVVPEPPALPPAQPPAQSGETTADTLNQQVLDTMENSG